MTRRSIWMAICAGIATAVASNCPAATLFGINDADGMVRFRQIDTNRPSEVKELGVLPVANDANVHRLASGGDGSLGLIQDGTDADGEPTATVVDIGDPSQAIFTVGESSFVLPDRSAEATWVVAPTTDVRLVSYAHRSSRPPFGMATYTRSNGSWHLADTYSLPGSARLGNLTRCPDGTVYGTWRGSEGAPQLVVVDWAGRHLLPVAGLTLNDVALRRDVASLACGPGGEVFALMDPLSRGGNSLYRVDRNSGRLAWVAAFDADSIAFAAPRDAAK